MARLNINLAPELKEAVERETTKKLKMDWRALIGSANQFPENPNPRFKSHDDLWEKDK